MGVLGDRLMRVALACQLLALVFFGVNAVHPVLPWGLLWLPGLAAAVPLVVNAWRTAKATHLPAPTRRLWWHLMLGSILVGLGYLAEAVDAVTTLSPTGPQVSAGQLIFQGAAIVLLIYTLLRLPFGKQTRGEVFRVVLDAGTIMLACAVFIWHFSTRYAIHSTDRPILFTSLALTVLALQAVFAVAKAILTTHSSYLDGGSLRMLGIAVCAGALFPTVRPLTEMIDPRRVALDDFGTGQSTLTMLLDCPVDELKLDRSFTQASRPQLADGVLQLARAMGLRVVAEGVETPDQLARLRDLGYPAAQGYLFARPLPADEFGKLLAGSPRTATV